MAPEPAGLGIAGVVHLVVFGVVLPLGAWYSQRRLAREPLPPRVPYFVSVIVQQVAFAAIALGIAGVLDLDLFPPYRLTARDGALAVVLLTASIGALGPTWRRLVLRRERFVALVAPRTATERALWVGVACSAGVGEEIVYRGVFFAILAPLIGVPVAVVVSALAFALGHLAQGWRAAPVVFAFAVGFHLLALATGTLLLAMAVHVAYDLVAGLTYGRLAERYGYPLDVPPPAETPS